MAAELNPRYELMEVLVSARAATAAADSQRPATDDDNNYGIHRSVGGGGGGVIMEGILEKSLYDIGDPDLMDVWDTDLNPVSRERERVRRLFVVTSRLSPLPHVNELRSR